MPETVFINDDQLELEIAAELLRRGAGIVVGRSYESRTYEVIRDLDGFASSRTFGAKQYYVIHPSFSKRRLLFGRSERGFYIRQRYGGPVLDLSLVSEQSDAGGARLFSGSIHFYPTTLRDGAPPERAPEALRQFYLDLRKHLFRGASKWRRGRSIYLVTKRIAARLSGGGARIAMGERAGPPSPAPSPASRSPAPSPSGRARSTSGRASRRS